MQTMGGEPTAPEEHPDLGLLFVHGIGTQEKGATLVAWLDPLSRWMDDWLRGAARFAAQCGVSQESLAQLAPSAEAKRLLDAARVPAKARYPKPHALEDPRLQVVTGDAETRFALLTGSDAPAQAEVRLRGVDTRGTETVARVKVVEAFWQDAFPKPTWSETAYWLLRIAPLIVLLHFGQPARERWNDMRRTRSARALLAFLGSALQLPVAIAVLPVVQLVFFLFAAFGWIPVPGYGSVIAWFQEVVAGILGDAHMFATSPTRLAAVVGRTRTALDALTPCKKIVVVAHSQGAAVAYSVLKEHCPENLAGLITLGSGLKKLEYLKGLRQEHDVSVTFVVSYPLTTMTIAFVYGAAQWLEILPSAMAGWGDVAALFTLLGVVVLTMASLLPVTSTPVEQWWRGRRAANPSLRWLDVFASRDPVSAGRLFPAPLEGMDSVAVTNRASWMVDHTSYWENTDEFVTLVGTWISRVGELAVPLHALNTTDAQLAREAASRRALRVGVLTLCTWVVGGAAILAAIAGLGTPIGALANAHHGDGGDRWWGLSDVHVGWLAVIGAACAVLGVTRGLWQLWDRRESKDFCNREPDVNTTILFVILVAAPSAFVGTLTVRALIG